MDRLILSFGSNEHDLIHQLANDLSNLSNEDRIRVYDEVVAFLEQDEEFANTCHDPLTGRFCEKQNPNPLKGKSTLEKGKLILGTVRSVWKERVSEFTKLNIVTATASAGFLLTHPGIREQIMSGSPEAMMYLAAGFMALLWKESRIKR